jgi:hypothetical protein
MPKPLVCPECKAVYYQDHNDREDGCCSRHCARIRQARRGEPSQEDKEARFVEEMMASHRRIFKPVKR